MALLSPGLLSAQPARLTLGGIQGLVLSEDGIPVSGAYVVANSQGPGRPASSSGRTAGDGSFKLANVPAGRYSLCVQVPGGGYLDSCLWPAKPAAVTVTARQTSTGNELRVRKGSILRVRVNDPKKALDTQAGSVAPDLVMGIWTRTSLFQPLTRTAQDAGGADYQTSVPFDTPLELYVVSKQLQIQDESGARLSSAGAKIPFQHSAGSPNKALVLTIAGREKGN